uniref:Syndecan n=1 Tax=Culicoides sonorensis TaxID=179676 RepID=A0A336JZH7_CULSO
MILTKLDKTASLSLSAGQGGPIITPSQQTNTLTTISSSGSSTTAKDEIYIDDDNNEGSGDRRGNIHGDLEKDDEDDYSGSGYGDDDEDTRHPVNRGNTNYNRGHTGDTDHEHTNKDNSGSGDGPHFDPDSEDNPTDDDELWTDVTHSEIPEKPHIKEENIPFYNKPDTDDNDLGISEEDPIQPKNTDIDQNNLNTHNTNNNNNFNKETDVIMNKNEDRTTSFFAQPGILAAVIGGAVVGLLCAILVVMFIVYRMRKKDEGSYALDEPKRSPTANTYAKSTHNREFYA